MNTDDKTDNCKNNHAKLEEHLLMPQAFVMLHWHHLPLYEEGKQEKIYTSSGLRKPTATVGTPTGAFAPSMFYHI